MFMSLWYLIFSVAIMIKDTKRVVLLAPQYKLLHFGLRCGLALPPLGEILA
jgi:hypothetical protein